MDVTRRQKRDARAIAAALLDVDLVVDTMVESGRDDGERKEQKKDG